MITKLITPSTDLAEARKRFMQSLDSWINACMTKYETAPPTDVHDQGTYTTGWEPYLKATGDQNVLHFLKQVRDAIHEYFTRSGKWAHGYWKMQEAHHGTEHFELFLGMLFRLDPGDAETRRQLLDVAEHIGNWVPSIPPWFDAQTGLFRSMYMGTGGVRTEPGMELNIPDHLRFVNLCLLAHAAANVEGETDEHQTRYLDFATRYAGKWAAAMLTNNALPVGLAPSGPIYDLDGEAEAAYRSFVGMVGHLDDNVDRAENFLASNSIGAFLKLWQYTGQRRFRQATERLLDILASQLYDPDAGAAADAIRAYRRATGDPRYDPVIEVTVQGLDPYTVREIGLEPDVRRESRPHGIGKRTDKPNWFEDGRPMQHNPILLSVAAELHRDSDLATRALDLGRTMFELACDALPDGRHHGCAANTISAIARGHGRENHAGVTTAILGALTP